MAEKKIWTMKRALWSMALAAAICMTLGVTASAEDSIRIGKGDLALRVEKDPFQLVVTDAQGREILATDGPVCYTRVTGQRTWRLVLWWLWNRGIAEPWTRLDKVTSVAEEDGRLLVGLGSGRGDKTLAELEAYFIGDKSLKVEMKAAGETGANRFRVRFKKDRDDRYFGMGERYNSAEQTGRKVRVWTEEGGLGLYNWSKYVKLPFNPFPLGEEMTYYPVPFFLNPAKGYGFLLDDDRFSEFDFGKTIGSRLSIVNWNDKFDFVVFGGPSPLEVIENQTAYTGRITVPTPWAFAPMNAAVESQDRVLEVARLLREEGIPTTAIWSESWWWRVEWEVNRELYPEYEKMNDELHDMGFRHLSYYQPYITKGVKAYEEGDAKGYFIKDKKGRTYDFTLGLWEKAQLDLTNPEARNWWKREFFHKSEEMGADGWMHDFGEHIPPDSVAHDGRTGWELHNDYVLLWHELGREFWDEARPDGDYFIYVRSGYTGAQKYVSVMWTGDQNTNFEKLDGLAANVPAILSVGISGHPIGTTDIAGFNCFVSKDTDRELFMRWTELGAMLPVMRIHRGQDEFCDNWSFDQDPETLEHYKKYAVLHTSLFPYFYTLAMEAQETGRPVTRHMMLHYPEDPEAWNQDYQYLIGDRLLVAPVIERGAREREVYFPPGEWVHWWSGRKYSGPGREVVPAPLGEVPLFLEAGKMLPLFDGPIDTLAKEDDPEIRGWDEANSSIQVRGYGIEKDEFTLWDGTVLTYDAEKGAGSASNAPVERKYDFDIE